MRPENRDGGASCCWCGLNGSTAILEDVCNLQGSAFALARSSAEFGALAAGARCHPGAAAAAKKNRAFGACHPLLCLLHCLLWPAAGSSLPASLRRHWDSSPSRPLLHSMGLLVEPAAKAAVPLAEGLLENGVPCSSAQEPSAGAPPAIMPHRHVMQERCWGLWRCIEPRCTERPHMPPPPAYSKFRPPAK